MTLLFKDFPEVFEDVFWASKSGPFYRLKSRVLGRYCPEPVLVVMDVQPKARSGDIRA